jgi:hypothetical protein
MCIRDSCSTTLYEIFSPQRFYLHERKDEFSLSDGLHIIADELDREDFSCDPIIELCLVGTSFLRDMVLIFLRMWLCSLTLVK